jgi:hypothetical protein
MRYKIYVVTIIISTIFYFSIFACTSKSDVPAKTVELYYDALVVKDEARLRNFTCADWEATALLEFDSFANVSTELVDFECQTLNEDNDIAEVKCTGSIYASYGEEIREFSLSDVVFKVIVEGGEWRICGYE